jgi:hypothetical protein
LSIASVAQLRNAKAKSEARKAEAATAAASAIVAPRSGAWRASLPDSATRQYLAQEVQGLLLSLRNQALKSGVLSEEDGPATGGSGRRANGTGNSAVSNSLVKLLPRPETARQQRVLEEMVQGISRRDAHSAGHSQATTASLGSTATSAPPSRPASGGHITARPSTARQRSLSSLSQRSADSPRDEAGVSLSAAAATLSQSLLSPSPMPQSARSALIDSLRQVLQEEHAALLQDVEYLQFCLELEMDEAVEGELRDKRIADLAAAKPAVSEAPASVPELRALNEQLKAALAAEELRARTLQMMGAVDATRDVNGQAKDPMSLASRGSGVASSPVPPSSASSGSFASGFGKSPGPLKAVRVPSASRVRASPSGSPQPGSGTLLCSSPAASPATSPLPSQPLSSLSARFDEVRSSYHPAGPDAFSALPPAPSADQSLQQLMDSNADLFGNDAAAAPAPMHNTEPAVTQPRPLIPALQLGALHLDGHASSTPSIAATAVDVSASAPAPARPMSARSSKLRSRLEGALNFQPPEP